MAEHFLYVATETGQERPVKLGTSANPARHLRQLQAGNPRRLLIRAAWRIVAASPAQYAGELAQAIRRLSPDPRADWQDVPVGEVDQAVRQLNRHLSRPQQGRLVGAKRGFEAFAAEDLPDRFQLLPVPEAEMARWQEQADREGALECSPPARLTADNRMAVDAAIEAVARNRSGCGSTLSKG
ncbi:MAG TPA: hypothetical protein VD978_01615 [Azospirillum sp.]|nr:hypothetical protein [Azospirillum sp.]